MRTKIGLLKEEMTILKEYMNQLEITYSQIQSERERVATRIEEVRQDIANEVMDNLTASQPLKIDIEEVQ